MVFDWDKGKSLTLEPSSKKAFVLTMTNMPKGKMSMDKDPLGWLRVLLTDARDKPDFKRESLGEKEIDGRRVAGFRVNAVNGTVISLWGDPKTGLPVCAEVTMGMFNNSKMTLSDFEFNVEMDESLFSTDPPAGYTVQDMGKVDLSPADEKDLIETLRECSLMKKPLPKKGDNAKGLAALDEGGLFPDTLDLMAIIQIVAEKFVPGMGPKPSDEQMRKMSDAQIRLQRGVQFAAALPPEADAHYAGKGVRFGEADKPIFWYRPTGAKKYRVIYADLTVREADAAPNVPNAQKVPGNSPSLSEAINERKALPAAKEFKPMALPSDLKAPAATIAPKALEAPGSPKLKK
jgi:hypothetical protein